MTPGGLLEGIEVGSRETLADHRARFGPLPQENPNLIAAIEQSGLRGRGGAAFPVGSKWASVAQRSSGKAVVVANGAEGEPLSRKDRFLMEHRPHLVLDGAELAARSVGAGRLVVYVSQDKPRALASMRTALSERRLPRSLRVSVTVAPGRYIAGEETAVVNCINNGLALPTSKPPRAFERGVDQRPTVVQNVESLAWTALIARYGPTWFRGLGMSDATPGNILLTVSGAVERPGVVELPNGSYLSSAMGDAGAAGGSCPAVLLGGYFGSWLSPHQIDSLRLDSQSLRARGLSLGCGVIHVLPQRACGVAETAAIVDYLARESARQCGPCVFGLQAMAEALHGLGTGNANVGDLERLTRWAGEVRGRGGCGHPDGAAGLVASALTTFAEDFAVHAETHSHRAGAA